MAPEIGAWWQIQVEIKCIISLIHPPETQSTVLRKLYQEWRFRSLSKCLEVTKSTWDRNVITQPLIGELNNHFFSEKDFVLQIFKALKVTLEISIRPTVMSLFSSFPCMDQKKV